MTSLFSMRIQNISSVAISYNIKKQRIAAFLIFIIQTPSRTIESAVKYWDP